MSQYGPPGGPPPGQPQEPWSPEQYGEPADPWSGSQQETWSGATSAPGSPPAGVPGSSGGYGDPGYQESGYPDPRYGGPGHVTGGYGATGYPAAADRGGGVSADPASGDPAWAAGDSRPWGMAAGQPSGEWHRPGSPGPGRPVGAAPQRGRRTPVIVLIAVLAVLVFGGLGTTVYLITQGGGARTPADQGAAPADQQSGAPASGGPDATADPSPAPQGSTGARFAEVGQCVHNEGSVKTPELRIVDCDDDDTFEVLKRIDGETTGEADAKAKCADVEGYTNWYFFNSELDDFDFVLCLKK